MKRHISICLAVSLILLFFSVSAFAAPYRHSATGLVFPDRLASMKKGEVRDFEKDNPGLGVSIGYNAPGIALTIFIYDYRIKEFPDGPGDPVMKQHFDQVLGDVMKMGEQGKYDYLILENIADEIVLGASKKGPRALSASFSYILNGEKSLSALYLISYKKNFIKIRFTYNENVKGKATLILRQLLYRLALMLRK
jgi:hypothetical protein